MVVRCLTSCERILGIEYRTYENVFWRSARKIEDRSEGKLCSLACLILSLVEERAAAVESVKLVVLKCELEFTLVEDFVNGKVNIVLEGSSVTDVVEIALCSVELR